jgi:hypothetical protein
VVSAHASFEGTETRLAVGNGAEGIQQVAGGSRQTVEPCYRYHVFRVELVEQAAKLGAVGLGSACHFAEHLLPSCLCQLPHLCANALTVHRDSHITVIMGVNTTRRGDQATRRRRSGVRDYPNLRCASHSTISKAAMFRRQRIGPRTAHSILASPAARADRLLPCGRLPCTRCNGERTFAVAGLPTSTAGIGTVGQVLRRMRCSGACGRVVAAWLVAGPSTRACGRGGWRCWGRRRGSSTGQDRRARCRAGADLLHVIGCLGDQRVHASIFPALGDTG